MNMIKIIGISILCMSIVGCGSASKVLTRDVYVAVTPPDNLYTCPKIDAASLPNPETATNQQVADSYAMLVLVNKKCWNSQQSVKNWIAKASTRIAQTNKNNT